MCERCRMFFFFSSCSGVGLSHAMMSFFSCLFFLLRTRIPTTQTSTLKEEEEGRKKINVKRRNCQAPAEVVVCAVGRVVMLPLMEMTAQSTALPALASCNRGGKDLESGFSPSVSDLQLNKCLLTLYNPSLLSVSSLSHLSPL